MPSDFLRKHVRLGSIHTQVNYHRTTERATHASDMPAPAQAARIAKAAMKAADATRWRSDTNTYKFERRSMENFVCDPTEYKFNYRAEELPKPRPVLLDAFGTVKRVFFNDHFHRTVEMPTHSALIDKTPWNQSTQVPYAEKVRLQEAKDAVHRAAASKATLRITSRMGTAASSNSTSSSSSSSDMGGGGSSSGKRGYEGPKAREDRRCAETRALKIAEVEAAAPFFSDEARAGTLRWAANFRDSVSRQESVSPSPSVASSTASVWGGLGGLGGLENSSSASASSSSSATGSVVWEGSATGFSAAAAAAGRGAMMKPPTNLEKRYSTIVAQEIAERSALAGSRLESKPKATRWCYGP